MKDGPVPFGKSVQEIIMDCLGDKDVPVFPDFPAGHIPDNRALVLGRKVIMEVSNGELKLRNSK